MSQREGRGPRGFGSALLVALACLLLPATSLGQGLYAGVGAYLGVSFGTKGANVGAGLEAFAMMPIGQSAVFNRCALRGAGVGPIFQLGLVGADPQITFALQAGAGIDRKAYLFLAGQLGATRRFGAKRGWGVSFGPRLELAFLNAGLTHDPVFEETLLAGGVRYPPAAGVCGDQFE